ncbi:tetratricopeptide repeat protein [Ferrovibrio xuzhouensis]|uniref:Tetratricopeptide repeat protein n=1 Tax=Ferrovibrio xuzhouensis TaxID=1576914 RepID=A0ABV7VA00_9PROT
MSAFRIAHSAAVLAAVVLAVLLIAGLPARPVFAMGSNSDSSSAITGPADPDFTAGKAAIDRKDWAAAVPLFQKVVARDEKNADAFNWLGYALRNQGDYEKAFVAYNQALQINPKHRGAHEYLGEAYLKTDNLAKAEEQLKALDGLCTFGCPEYTELKNKIAAFKAAKPS